MRLGRMLVALAALSCAQAATYRFEDAQALLKTYCQKCHQGASPAGGFDVRQIALASSLHQNPERWNRIFIRVRNGEMPPKGLPAPAIEARESLAAWIETSLQREACAHGETPGPAPIRRLNRDEYSDTMRDLLNIHLDVGAALPADGAGGEGFDNAAETLTISPIHAEKYLDAARLALDFASRDAKARARFLIAEPGAGVSPEQAARQILEGFLPRAFRRPVGPSDVEPYLQLFQAAQKQRDTFQNSILFALQGVLISPQFLFRIEPPNPGPQPRLVDDYTLASRLSYFLWGSMPDSLLFDLAETGKLHDPEILKWQVSRMLRSPKALGLVQNFVEQWLGTRELGRTVNPDTKLFPMYADAELRGDIRYQPVLFFQELLARNESLLNLIDSKFSIMTRKLQRLYGLNVKPPRPDAGGQPQRIELPEDSHRGGLLGMSAVLAVSSYPYRTSPVLRGKWILDAMLGTPPPPPPPNVPTLNEHPGATAKTMRERLGQHRADPVCASCHSRIDPLGFALENYDSLGRWRTQDADGQPIDSKGELPDGVSFSGPEELKKVLLARKDVFIRNLTRKMLGYALGRGLTLSDTCTVDHIVADLASKDYAAGTLIEDIVMSPAFQYQAGASRKELRSSR